MAPKGGKRLGKLTKKLLFGQHHRKWDNVTAFEYPLETDELPKTVSLARIDMYRNMGDISIEGVQLTYTDGT